MVDAGFGEDVNPTVVRVVEESYGVVHGGLVYATRSPRWIAVDWKSLPESEEEGVQSGDQICS